MKLVQGQHGRLRYLHMMPRTGQEPLIVGLTGFAMGLTSRWDYLHFPRTSQLIPYGREAGFQVMLVEPPQRTWTRSLNPFNLFRLPEAEVEERVDTLGSLIRRLGRPPAEVTLAGFSDGGVAVQHVLGAFPDLIENVVIYSAIPAPNLAELAAPVRGKRIQVLRHDKEWFVSRRHVEDIASYYRGANDVQVREVRSRHACRLCPLKHHYWEPACNADLFPARRKAQGASAF